MLRGAIDVITDLRAKASGRGVVSTKIADMRLALNGLHDQLIEAGRKEMERWATREREIEVFAEQTARLPWTGWAPPSIYPIEVYRAVVDRVIKDNDPLKPRVSLAEIQASLAKLATQYEPGKRHGIASEVVAEAIESMQANMVAVRWEDAIGDVIIAAIRAGVERALDCWTESDKEHDDRAHACVETITGVPTAWLARLKGMRAFAIVGELVGHIAGLASGWDTLAAAATAAKTELASLQAAHDKVLQDDSGVVADAAASVERMQEHVFKAAELADRLLVWAGADECYLLGKQVLELSPQVWASRGTAIIAAIQRARDANARAHSWVGKVGNERCWRCHILRDSVAGTVDCPAMTKPEAAPVDG